MDRFIKSVVLSGFLMGSLIGCGGGGPSSRSSAANQASVDNLSNLMTAHPEFSRADLGKIKDASKNSKPVSGVPSVAKQDRGNTALHAGITNSELDTSDSPVVVPPAHPATKTPNDLDPGIAAKAQDLIDDVLDKFDFQKEFNASLKMTGIAMNEVKEMMKQFKEMDKSLAGAKGDMPGGGKFDIDMKEMSCETVVNNPFSKAPKIVFEQIEARNREQIKATISGCEKISGAEFVQCFSDYNKFITHINDFATCDMQTMNDLAKSVSSSTGEDLQKLGMSIQKCMMNQFAGCGFTMQKVNEQGEVVTVNQNRGNIEGQNKPQKGARNSDVDSM